MSTNSKAIQAVKQRNVANTDAESNAEGKGLFGRIKHLISKVAVVDQDWIFKSKDWPYLWPHK